MTDSTNTKHPQSSAQNSEKEILQTKAEDISRTETAYLAGGCFWGMEELIRKIPGVKDVDVGYMGGDIPQATYQKVKSGTTNHAETVKIVFDPQRLSFEKLLFEFFRMHDPTTKNRQGNDIGSQYRSAIFCTHSQQFEIAKQVIEKVEKSGVWGGAVQTEISPAKDFWIAEDEHQDYLQKFPNGYSCHYLRNFQFE